MTLEHKGRCSITAVQEDDSFEIQRTCESGYTICVSSGAARDIANDDCFEDLMLSTSYELQRNSRQATGSHYLSAGRFTSMLDNSGIRFENVTNSKFERSHGSFSIFSA